MTTFTRPDGRTYRPRSPLRFDVFEDHEARDCLVVEFTHDVDAATRRAEVVWWAHSDCPLPEGRPVWWRRVPWDTGTGYDQNWIEDERRGSACVVFDHRDCCP